MAVEPQDIVQYGLTRRMRECLSFIESFVAEKGYSPSYDEIRVALGAKSKAMVFRLIHSLHERGLVRHMPKRPRSVTSVSSRGVA